MDTAEKRDLIGRLFALLTAKLEDCSELAAKGQAAGPDAGVLGQSIRTCTDEIATIADAAIALTPPA